MTVAKIVKSTYYTFFFTLYDPLISNFALTPPIENSKMPDKIHENYIFAKGTFPDLI